MDALVAGGSLGPFRLVARISVGGMGEVWSAVGPRPDRSEGPLALKVMHPHLVEHPEFHAMFTDEVAISRRLRHENIVTVYEGYELEGQLVQAMELIEGLDLRRVLARLQQRGERFPVPLALHVGRCVARALGYAHLKRSPRGRPLRIVHRDVSPHNIMLAHDGRVKVLDFGIAKATERSAATRVGIVKGKSAYMAPEQTIGAELDHRTDIFATGVVLWEALAGERLFRAGSTVETMARVREGDAPRLEERRPDLPREVASLVHEMLSPDPERRPPSMLDVERAMQAQLLRRFEPERYGPVAVAAWMAGLRSPPRRRTDVLPPADPTLPDPPHPGEWPEDA